MLLKKESGVVWMRGDEMDDREKKQRETGDNFFSEWIDVPEWAGLRNGRRK